MGTNSGIDNASGQPGPEVRRRGKPDPDPSIENMALDDKMGRGNRGAEREACAAQQRCTDLAGRIVQGGSAEGMQVLQFAANVAFNFNNWAQTHEAVDGELSFNKHCSENALLLLLHISHGSRDWLFGAPTFVTANDF